MSEIIEFKHNQERGAKRRQFKNGFPNKATVKTRIGTVIDNMDLSLGDKTKFKKLFNGDGQTPGIIDALFYLDR